MLLLIPLYGTTGGVASSAVSIGLMALALVISTRTLTGFDGSVLRLLPSRRIFSADTARVCDRVERIRPRE